MQILSASAVHTTKLDVEREPMGMCHSTESYLTGRCKIIRLVDCLPSEADLFFPLKALKGQL